METQGSFESAPPAAESEIPDSAVLTAVEAAAPVQEAEIVAQEEPAYIPPVHVEAAPEHHEKPVSDDAATMPHYPKPHGLTLEEALSVKHVEGESARQLATYLRDVRAAA